MKIYLKLKLEITFHICASRIKLFTDLLQTYYLQYTEVRGWPQKGKFAHMNPFMTSWHVEDTHDLTHSRLCIAIIHSHFEFSSYDFSVIMANIIIHHDPFGLIPSFLPTKRTDSPKSLMPSSHVFNNQICKLFPENLETISQTELEGRFAFKTFF